MLKPGTKSQPGMRASLCLAALFLAAGFMASALAQSAKPRSQPNSDQQPPIRKEIATIDLWLRSSSPQNSLATNVQGYPSASPTAAVDFQFAQGWTEGKMGLTTPKQIPKGLTYAHQDRNAAHGEVATPRAANATADLVPAGTSPLDTSIVLAELCVSTTRCAAWFSTPRPLALLEEPPAERQIEESDKKAGEASIPPLKIVRPPRPVDFNQDIYYKNKLEFSFETGWHPVNIPFVYDFAVGDSYNETPLRYTLVPLIASLRWHVNDVKGRWIFRGNFDFTFSLSATLIPRGPETHYFAFIFGIRRNFVHRNWRIVPYFDQRGGIGIIDAKEPLGVLFAQGQDLTFTYDIGTGVRYNLNPRYSVSAGMNYMHISNGYLSEPKFTNYGINVYGPMLGIDVRWGKPRHPD